MFRTSRSLFPLITAVLLFSCASKPNQSKIIPVEPISIGIPYDLDQIIITRINDCAAQFNLPLVRYLYAEVYPDPNEFTLLIWQGLPENYSDLDRKAYKIDPIYSADLSIIVHPDNKVEGLSVADLRMILSGQIQNWESITNGGLTGPILLILYYPDYPIRSLIKHSILEGLSFATNAQITSSQASAVNMVKSNPLGLSVIFSDLPAKEVRRVPLIDSNSIPPLPTYLIHQLDQDKPASALNNCVIQQ